MNRLRELRLSRNLSTVELGKLIGLDPSMITHVEKGRKQLSLDSLERACRYFGVSVDYLLGKSPDEMFADFVSSIDQNWRTVSFDASGEPTQVYAEGVSRPLQLKFDILRLMNETDDEVVLRSVYEYFHASVLPREFVETAEEELSYAERVEKVAKIVRLLFAMDSPALDLILQTAILQKRQG